HELTGAVIRDVAAALDLEHLDVAGREHVLVRLATAAEREHVRVLDDHERVLACPIFARLDERELARPDVPIGRRAEIQDLPGIHRNGLPTRIVPWRSQRAALPGSTAFGVLAHAWQKARPMLRLALLTSVLTVAVSSSALADNEPHTATVSIQPMLLV